MDAGLVLRRIYKEAAARVGFEIPLAVAGQAASVRVGDWRLAVRRQTRDPQRKSQKKAELLQNCD
jgi:hypothetical protein